MIQAEADVVVPGDADEVRLRLRISQVFELRDGRWLNVHVHASLPALEQAEGESFPIDALRARNKELERVVAERTTDLERAYREAQLEAALERVRARAMAMRHSDELASVAAVLFRQQQALGIETQRSGIGLIEEDADHADVWTASTSVEGEDVLQLSFQIPLHGHPTVEGLYQAWKRQEAFYTYDLSGDDLKAYVQFMVEREMDVHGVRGGLRGAVSHFEALPRSSTSPTHASWISSKPRPAPATPFARPRSTASAPRSPPCARPTTFTASRRSSGAS